MNEPGKCLIDLLAFRIDLVKNHLPIWAKCLLTWLLESRPRFVVPFCMW